MGNGYPWYAPRTEFSSIPSTGIPSPVTAQTLRGHPDFSRTLTIPRRSPSDRRRPASSLLSTSASSHKDLPCLGSDGGVSAKSRGFLLCSGLPPYVARAASAARSSVRSATIRALWIRRLGFGVLLGLTARKISARTKVCQLSSSATMQTVPSK